jgi:hypothetical protein
MCCNHASDVVVQVASSLILYFASLLVGSWSTNPREIIARRASMMKCHDCAYYRLDKCCDQILYCVVVKVDLCVVVRVRM